MYTNLFRYIFFKIILPNQAVQSVVGSLKTSQLLDNVAPPPQHQSEVYRDALEGIDMGFKTAATTRPVTSVKLFLNRLLGCTCTIQNEIFEYFERALEAEIILAKKEARFEECINEFDLSSKEIVSNVTNSYLLSDSRTIQLSRMLVRLGMNWDEASDLYTKTNADDGLNGFYYPTFGYSQVYRTNNYNCVFLINNPKFLLF